MTVSGLRVDQATGSAVLLLEDEERNALPICIGLAEATSIAKELQGITLPRPLTHDLFRDVLARLGATLVRIEVTALRENTYYAELVLSDPAARELRVDARPSDAIALAVRTAAPIYVHEQVLRKALPDAQDLRTPTDKEEWKKLLEDMDPEEFGKYKM
jgi:bifunctional DNase/RNase